jgi:hypothetical protein
MNYQHLTPYKTPANYIGADWFGYYDVTGRHRDSDTLTNCNHGYWLEFLTKLLGPADTVVGKEPEPVGRSTFGDEKSDDIYNWTVCRESHCMVGWVEIIRVSELVGEEKLQAIDDQLHRLDGYPIFDEDAFSEAEQKEYENCWYNCGAAQDFRREVRKAFLEDNQEDPEFGSGDSADLAVMLDAFDELPVDKLIELHERLIPSGEYHDSQGWPHIDFSVAAMTWDDLVEVTLEQ